MVVSIVWYGIEYSMVSWRLRPPPRIFPASDIRNNESFCFFYCGITSPQTRIIQQLTEALQRNFNYFVSCLHWFRQHLKQMIWEAMIHSLDITYPQSHESLKHNDYCYTFSEHLKFKTGQSLGRYSREWGGVCWWFVPLIWSRSPIWV